MTDSPRKASDSASPPPDLLDFTPVVRKIKRPDGWTPELQREFIRRLCINGSPQQTCIEMGKHATGIEALYKVPGADSFRAAWDEAVRIGRTAMGLDCGAPHLGPVPGIRRRPTRNGARPLPYDDEEGEPEPSYEDRLAVFHSIYCKYMIKVEQEREARLAGEVVRADFTLRQLTCIEVMLDLMALKLESNGWEMLRQARMGKHGLLDIAETDMSRCLDAARREVWAEMDEPDRPEHPPRRYLQGYEGYSTEPTDALHGGDKAFRDEQIATRKKQHREDAAAQIEWERRAVSPGD